MSQECRNDCVEELLFPKAVENRAGNDVINSRFTLYDHSGNSWHFNSPSASLLNLLIQNITGKIRDQQ